MLGVFLASRGNMKELERFLGVSYPTARQRFNELLDRLGLGEPAPTSTEIDVGTGLTEREAVLRRLAAGELDVDEAERLLGRVS